MDACFLTDAFARTLLFYYLFLRPKLNVSDLEKIARKYKSNSSDKLLVDLQTKYSYFPIPTQVSRGELSRIIAEYNVPNSYLDRISTNWKDGTIYDSSSDMYSTSFDPLQTLTKGKIISSSYPEAPPVDNMAKVKLLYLEEIVTEDGETLLRPLRRRAVDQFYLKKVDSIDNNRNSGATAAAATTTTENSIITKPLHQHIFDVIAEFSMKQVVKNSNSSYSSSASTSSVDSPLQLLYRLMKSNSRARIILRRSTGVRGAVEAYVKAFDRHFNMLLADVDEEYILNKQKIRKMKLGHFINKGGIIRRHLPQLLLRGDNVILVFEAARITFSNSSSSSSSSSASLQKKN